MIGQPPQMPAPMPQQAQGPQAAAPDQQPVTIDDVVELLRDGVLRRFRIDIEVDSTVSGDESQERQDRSAFIETTTKFIQAWGPIVEQQPALTQLAGELLLFGVRGFRVGRSLEEVVEETVDKMEQIGSQPKPPPQPSPDEMVKLEGTKVKTAAEVQRAGMGVQQAAQDAHAKQQQTQLDIAGKVLDHHLEREKHGMDMQRLHAEAGAAAVADQREAELSDQQHRQAMAAAKKPKGKD